MPDLEEIDLADYADTGLAGLGTPLIPPRRYRNSLTGTFPIPADTAPAQVSAPKAPFPEDQALIQGLKREVPVTTVEDDAARLGWNPEELKVMGDRGKIERAKTLSATLDISFSDAYDNEPGLSAAMTQRDPNWLKMAGQSFVAGIGDLYVLAGRAAQWAGFEDAGKLRVDFGRRIISAYAPPVSPKEFTYSRAADPEWWATTAVRSLPASLSLIPAAVLAGYAGATGAAATGLGIFGRTVVGSLVAAPIKRAMEAGMEGSQEFDAALAKGLTREEASTQAENVFKANLALTGVDAAELLLAFTPLHVVGDWVPKILRNRILSAGLKLAGVGAMEAGEEMVQQGIQQWAGGDSFWQMTPEMKESGALGFIFGVGLGGAGSVYEGLTSHVESNLPGPLATQYLADFQSNLNLGQDEHSARLNALDKLASTPEGEKAVTDAVKKLKDTAEGNGVAPTSEEMQQAIDTQPNAEMFDATIPESEIDNLLDPNFEAVASGEISAEQVLGEPAPELTPEQQTIAETQAKGDNFFISEETYAKAKAALKEKTSGLHAGFDPTALVDLVTIASYHIERFGRNFAEWANALVANYGDIPAELLRKSWDVAIKHADIGERAKRKAEASMTGKLGRTPQQAVMSAIDDHARMIVESTSGLTYKGQAFNRAVKEGNNIRLIGDKTDTLVRGQGILDIEENIPFDIPGEEPTNRPLGEHALEAKIMAQQIERASMPARDVKRQVRLTTGQERIVRAIGEDVALRAAFKKAEQASRVAFREGSKEGMARAKAEMRDVMLKAKVKDEWRGFALGYKYGEKVTGNELYQTYKAAEKEQFETRKALAELIQENLPKELQGEFLDAMVKKLTEKRVNTLLTDIQAASESHTKQELIDELSDLKQVKGSVDVEYQKRINELLRDINTKKITGKTLSRLESLMTYSASNGIPSGVSQKMLADLNRLQMTQAQNMTIEDLRDLRDMADHLTEMGKLKRKLKMRNNERERRKAMDALMADTVNADMKSEAAKGALAVYMEVLSPLRAAERFDGYKTRGQNYKMVQSLSQHENNAQWNVRTELDSALKEMIDAGITEIEPEREPVIMAHIRMLEGSEFAAQKIIDKHGLQNFDLTPQEEALIKILEKYTTKHVNRLAALYEEITNQPFPKRERYILPLKYEGEFNVNPSEAILQTPHATTQTERGMTIERQKAVNKDPRVDVMAVFEQALNEQQWFLEMQPAIDDVRQLVKTKEYAAKAGAAASEFWTRYLDVVARRGWSNKATHGEIARIMRAARGNITTAVLGYRLSSIIMQPFAVMQAMAQVSAEFGPTAAARVLAEFGKTWISPGRANDIISQSKALQQRQAGEVAVSEAMAEARTGSLKDRFIRNGMKLLQKGDVITAAGVQEGVRKILESRGESNARAESETIMQLVSSSSDVTLRPLFLSRGEGARTLATFQTFTMNQFGILAHDIATKGFIKGDFHKRMAAVVGLSFLVAGEFAQDWAREFIYETVKRRDKQDSKLPGWVRVMFSQARTVPVIGPAFDVFAGHGGSSEVPLMKFINDVVAGVRVPFTQTDKTKSEKTWKTIFKAIEAGSILVGGKPGTSQGFDVLEGLLFPEEKNKGRSDFRP